MGVLFDCPALAKRLPEETERDLARNAYRVELAGNRLVWVTRDGDKEVRYNSEPGVGLWKRVKVKVLKLAADRGPALSGPQAENSSDFHASQEALRVLGESGGAERIYAQGPMASPVCGGENHRCRGTFRTWLGGNRRPAWDEQAGPFLQRAFADHGKRCRVEVKALVR